MLSLEDVAAEVFEMLKWEYDAEAERRVIAEEAEYLGFQKGLYLAKLLQEGKSYEDALKQVNEHDFEMYLFNGKYYLKNPPP